MSLLSLNTCPYLFQLFSLCKINNIEKIEYSKEELGEVTLLKKAESQFNKIFDLPFFGKLFFTNIISLVLSIFFIFFIMTFQGCSSYCDAVCKPRYIEKIKYIEKPCPKLQTVTPSEIGVDKNDTKLDFDIVIKKKD